MVLVSSFQPAMGYMRAKDPRAIREVTEDMRKYLGKSLDWTRPNKCRGMLKNIVDPPTDDTQTCMPYCG